MINPIKLIFLKKEDYTNTEKIRETCQFWSDIEVRLLGGRNMAVL